MNVASFQYKPGVGWSCDFPSMDSKQTAVLLFGDSNLLDNPQPIRDVVKAFPNSHILGCSTSGEILTTQILDDCLTAAVLQFENTKLHSATASVDSAADSFQAGMNLASEFPVKDLRSIIVFSDGHDVNGSELIRGLRAVFSDDVIITGGLAGDDDRFERTWVLANGRPMRKHIQAIGFYGDAVQIGHGSEGGWDVFGPERLVTSSKGNVLAMLDGEPALTVYKKYLGEEAEGLPATALLYPLAVRIDGELVVRTVLGIDEQKQTITFAGDVPEGCRARFMMANPDRLVEGAAESARHTCQGNNAQSPVFALAVSCVGRRLVLGERVEEELEAVADVLPPGSSLVGFYSYGEISPGTFGGCSLHNQTMTLTSISEKITRDSQAA